jgi:GNAT superfamily N-acetyltransferase
VKTGTRVESFRLEWRGAFDDSALSEVHAAAFQGPRADRAWLRQVRAHSLGWVCARDAAGDLIGFVNVAWDGAAHAFVLDAVVRPAQQREGVGSAMVKLAIAKARSSGCEWLHVDFDATLEPFYRDACGFTPTSAGLISLDDT